MESVSLANRVFGLLPNAILDYFISGLREDIRIDVLAQCPVSLLKVVAIARLYEEKYFPSTRTHSQTQTYKKHNGLTTKVQQPKTIARQNLHPCYHHHHHIKHFLK